MDGKSNVANPRILGALAQRRAWRSRPHTFVRQMRREFAI
jgi:hypothetical protein